MLTVIISSLNTKQLLALEDIKCLNPELIDGSAML